MCSAEGGECPWLELPVEVGRSAGMMIEEDEWKGLSSDGGVRPRVSYDYRSFSRSWNETGGCDGRY